MKATFLIPAVLAVVALGACAHRNDRSDQTQAQAGQKAAAQPPRPRVQEHSEVNAVAKPAPAAQQSNDLISRMARDLAARLSVEVTEIQVVSLEAVVWDDGALGCPQPGGSYTAAQVPGFRAVFQHSGKTFQYHASERGHFVYCSNPAKQAGGLDER